MAVRLLKQLEAIQRDRNPRPEPEAAPDTGPQPIMDQSELLEGVDEVVREYQLTPTRAANAATFRTWLRACQWPIDTVIGVDSDGVPKATADSWKLIVRKAIDGMKSTIKHQQPNGDWQVIEADHEITKIDRTMYLRLGVRFVDVGGKEDLQYENGKAVVGVRVKVENNALTPETIAAIRGGDNGGALADMQKQLADMQRQLLEATARKKPGRKPGSTKAPAPKHLNLGQE